jgi:hypothetical protein
MQYTTSVKRKMSKNTALASLSLLVGFGRATRPSTARTRLFGLIIAARAPANRSFAAPYFISQ